MARSALHTEILEADEPLRPLCDRWRELAVSRGNAFVAPEWYFSWLRHYGDSARPYVVAVRDADGELVGLVPLVLSESKRLPTLSFAGANLGDEFHPVARAEDELEVARAAGRALAAERRNWAVMALHNVELDAPWSRALLDEAPMRLASVRDQPKALPKIELNGHDWDGYLATRSANFRGQLGRKQRRLEREHEIVYRRISDPAELRAGMADFFAIHDLRWSQKGGSSVAAARARAFLTDFAEALLEQGWLRLWFLELDGSRAASFLGWRVGDRYAYYLAGFDPAFAHASVGLVLLAQTIRGAIEEGATEYDMLLGDEAYKSRLATDSREVETLLVTRALHPARLLTSFEVGVRRAGRGLPAPVRDPLREVASRLLDRLPGSRER